MLNWDQLRFMIAVADSGSVSRAAMGLKVSHATVLRAINRLEDELQIRLFDHVKTGYRLTADGEEILVNARVMENNVQQILRKAKSRDAIPGGQLNVMVPDSTLFDLMPLFRSFTTIYDQITINLKSGTITKPADFIEHEVDVVVIVSNDPPEALVGRQVAHIQIGAYRHRDCEFETDEYQEWITWSQTDDFADELLLYQQQMLLQKDNPTRVIMNTLCHGDALKAVHAGLGASFLAQSAASEKLVEIPLPKKTGRWGIWVLTHPDFRTAARVTALMRFLADKLTST